MTDEIKSAREIALAKIEAASAPVTDQDRLRWKYVPEGEKLASRIINSDTDIKVELNKIHPEARPFLAQGAMAVLLSNIVLPSPDVETHQVERILKAIVELKKDKTAAREITNQIQHLFDHYLSQGEQQKKQAIEQLKNDYGRKLKHAIEQQLGTSAAGMVTDVENLPQFKEEKRRLASQFDRQYIDYLNEYKKALKETS